MAIIKFVKNDTIQNCDMTQLSEHVLKIVLLQKIDEEIILGGFELLNEYNYGVMGLYHDYNTIYEATEDELIYILSDDGSIKSNEDDNTSTIVPDIDIEPYEPSLDEVIDSKVNEINTLCQSAIVAGVDVQIDDAMEHFSYSIEDQANIDDIAQMAKSTGLEQSYHCDNGSCKLYTLEQIIQIYMAEKMNKAHNITYANQLKLYVKSLTDKTEVQEVVYGQDLIGEYLNTYNTIMTHEKKVAETFLGE